MKTTIITVMTVMTTVFVVLMTTIGSGQTVSIISKSTTLLTTATLITDNLGNVYGVAGSGEPSQSGSVYRREDKTRALITTEDGKKHCIKF